MNCLRPLCCVPAAVGRFVHICMLYFAYSYKEKSKVQKENIQ